MSRDDRAPARGTSGGAPARQRSIAEIEADIASHRENLVQTVTKLEVAVKVAFDPRRIFDRQIARIRGFYVDEYGGVRPERVAVTVGVVLTVVVIRRSRKRARARG